MTYSIEPVNTLSEKGSISMATLIKREEFHEVHLVHNLIEEYSLPLSDFGSSRWENDVLKPALQKRGLTDIRFGPGESDSFGPLTRVVYFKLNDTLYKHIYG